MQGLAAVLYPKGKRLRPSPLGRKPPPSNKHIIMAFVFTKQQMGPNTDGANNNLHALSKSDVISHKRNTSTWRRTEGITIFSTGTILPKPGSVALHLSAQTKASEEYLARQKLQVRLEDAKIPAAVS